MSDLIERLRECSDDWPAYLTKLDKEAADALEEQARRIAELEARLTQVEVNTANLKTIFRVHALRYIPNVTDTQIDEAIARACRGVGI